MIRQLHLFSILLRPSL